MLSNACSPQWLALVCTFITSHCLKASESEYAGDNSALPQYQCTCVNDAMLLHRTATQTSSSRGRRGMAPQTLTGRAAPAAPSTSAPKRSSLVSLVSIRRTLNLIDPMPRCLHMNHDSVQAESSAAALIMKALVKPSTILAILRRSSTCLPSSHAALLLTVGCKRPCLSAAPG